MSGRGDGSHNNRNGQQVNSENLPSGDQEPAYEPHGGRLGLLNNFYLALYNTFWRMNEILDVLYASDDDLGIDFDNVNDGNVNNVNIPNINVRDNNANELHDDQNAVIVGIENEDSDEAFEDCEDVHQYIPEEDPQPGVSRRRSREMDEEDVEPSKRIRWSEEFSDDDSDFISACDTDSEGCPHVGNIADEDIKEPLPGGSTKRSREEDVDEEEHNGKKSRLSNSSDELFEDALEELDNHEAGGSRKRSRDDFEEEEEYVRVCKFRRSSNESTSTSDDN
ncbi:unnamed protein product [Oreochromis niloticus]|nr:unnamed protein product [Mustela putorius furo]CAI5684560.1 unnamed protein product [Mustela putorius furo]